MNIKYLEIIFYMRLYLPYISIVIKSIDDHLQSQGCRDVNRSRPLGTEHAPGRLVSDGRRLQHGGDGRCEDRSLGAAVAVEKTYHFGGDSPTWFIDVYYDFRCLYEIF